VVGDDAMKIYRVGQHCVVVSGPLLKIGRLKQEFYFEIEEPGQYLKTLKDSGVRLDLFTFLHSFPQADGLHPYYMEWDNFAVIPIGTFEDWLRGVPRGTRRALKKSQEAGIDVRWVDFTDELIRQIMVIFNESPVRQGRPFWHYGKSFADVKEMLSRDIDRSRFLGAFWRDELVGFVKLIYGKNFARTTLIFSMVAHRDKYTNNAMIAKAIQVCIDQQIPYLVYGQIDYGKVGNPTLAEFKTNNGFRKMDLARYYVPLSMKGRLALRLGLHRGIIGIMPKHVVQAGLRVRHLWYQRRLEAVKPRRQVAGSRP
jgi:hypothetical protein